MSTGNQTYPRYELNDLPCGLEREHGFLVTREEVERFSYDIGDKNPLHFDARFSRDRGYQYLLLHGMLVSARCSAFIARNFIGSHGILVSMSSDFRHPVYCGDELNWRGQVVSVNADVATIELRWQVTNSRGVVVQLGTACSLLSKRS